MFKKGGDLNMEEFFMGITKNEIVVAIFQLKERIGQLEEAVKELAQKKQE